MTFTEKQNVIDVTTSPEADLEKAKQAADHFFPAYDRILIKREKSALERRMEKMGLKATDQTKETTKSAEGWLIKCGPTCDEEAVSLLGKRVLFAKYSGEDIIVPLPDGSKEEFVLATDTDIFGELK